MTASARWLVNLHTIIFAQSGCKLMKPLRWYKVTPVTLRLLLRADSPNTPVSHEILALAVRQEAASLNEAGQGKRPLEVHMELPEQPQWQSRFSCSSAVHVLAKLPQNRPTFDCACTKKVLQSKFLWFGNFAGIPPRCPWFKFSNEVIYLYSKRCNRATCSLTTLWWDATDDFCCKLTFRI